MNLNQRVARLAWPVIIVVVSFMLAPTASVGAPMSSSWDAKACGRVGGTLVFAQAADPDGLDPHEVTDGFSVNNVSNVFDTLVRFTADSTQVEPSLAESWTVSADNLVWTFKLRPGVKFHDGTPFNAEAVKYNFERMQDPKFPSARRSEIGPIQRVVAVDPYTVQITLEKPYSPLLYVLTDRAGMMVSPAAAQKEGLDFALHPVGTGPFSFVEKIPQDHITLQRNPNHWEKGLPYADRIVFRTITDDNARVANVKSGDVEIISLVPLPQVKQLSQEAAQPGARFALLQHG